MEKVSQKSSLDRVCVEERTEPPVCPAAASLGQKSARECSAAASLSQNVGEVGASMSPTQVVVSQTLSAESSYGNVRKSYIH